jgi:hypothetical protein
MSTHNAMSRAWEQVTALTDLPVNDLQKRFGVTSLNANSLTERLLAANGFALRFERRDKEIEISACIVDDSLPKGRVPRNGFLPLKAMQTIHCCLNAAAVSKGRLATLLTALSTGFANSRILIQGEPARRNAA